MNLTYSETPRVDYATAKKRAVAYLKKQPKLHGQRIPIPAQCVADVIWPGHAMRSQGAGGAASRILKKMSDEKLCRWTNREGNWGWVDD